eukprot:CAMPEP_0194380718 /NCGR_PEP_ID=MMETSP0174-20130528/47289_1 /TAXON_ID=216777 /ORGANISM="Proboscia alata, Strain PI-D3" /LENGTH=35 /DNA_ID= /DNA_START= /DNA_END= /DNA_ORIENTATION=
MEICGKGKTPGTQDGNSYRTVRDSSMGDPFPPTKT